MDKSERRVRTMQERVKREGVRAFGTWDELVQFTTKQWLEGSDFKEVLSWAVSPMLRKILHDCHDFSKDVAIVKPDRRPLHDYACYGDFEKVLAINEIDIEPGMMEIGLEDVNHFIQATGIFYTVNRGSEFTTCLPLAQHGYLSDLFIARP